ncbi:Mor transcription activator family protein [Vogesella mureinivorans]|uniref:Mor transcription activator family protein n=1 Tax=Vogesella mureinivorans TaxID=657276 RepID=UPI0011CB9F19|nr:Mor transcription activator family protein [Vogesella mureinivorans]
MNLDNVQHLLPESARLFISLIGLQKTMLLVQTWGGTTFPVSKNQTRSGHVRYEALAEVLGVEAADILTQHFGGEVLSIPLCKNALTESRNLIMCKEFDLMSSTQSATYIASFLARKYKMTERNVWRILKQTSIEDYPGQASLF